MAETLKRFFHRRSSSTPHPKNSISNPPRPASRASSFFGFGSERSASRPDFSRSFGRASFGRNRSRTSFFQPEDPADLVSSPYESSKEGPTPEFGDVPPQGNGRNSFSKNRSYTLSSAPPRIPHPIIEEENEVSLGDALGLTESKKEEVVLEAKPVSQNSTAIQRKPAPTSAASRLRAAQNQHQTSEPRTSFSAVGTTPIAEQFTKSSWYGPSGQTAPFAVAKEQTPAIAVLHFHTSGVMGAADVLKRLRRKSVGSGTASRPNSAGEELPIRPSNLSSVMPPSNQPPSSYHAPASSGPTQIANDHSPELSQHEPRISHKGPQQEGDLDPLQWSPVARKSIDKPLPAPPLYHQNRAHGSPNVKEALATNTSTPIADAFARDPPLPPTKSPGRAQEQEQDQSSQPIALASSAALAPSHAHRSEHHPNPSDRRSPVHPIHVDESNITERTVETDSNVTWNRPVVHETIQPTEHEERRELITRHIHNHHVIHRILPVKDVQVLPAKHYAPLGPGGALVEIPAPPGEVPGQSQSWTIVANPIAKTTGENPYPWQREVYKKDEKSYVTTDGIRRTETTWIHPARLEEGAVITGQSAPFEFVHTRTGDGSESTYYTASGSSNTSATTIAYRLEDQTRLNREAEEVVRRAEALAIDVKHDKGASTHRKKPLTAPAIPERKTPIHSRGPSVSHEDKLASSVPASHGRARATSNAQSRGHVAGPLEGARSSLDNAGATSSDAAQSARMHCVASSKPKKSAGHQPRSSQEVIDAAIAGLTGPNNLRAFGP